MFFRQKKSKKNNLPLNSTLYLKFIIVYIILGFLSLFTAATLASGLTYSGLKSSEGGPALRPGHCHGQRLPAGVLQRSAHRL